MSVGESEKRNVGKMNDILYIAGEECQDLPGVIKKIRNQIISFESKGIHTKLAFLERRKKIEMICPFSSSYRFDRIDTDDLDCLYVRWVPISYPMIKLLHDLKKINRRAKIVLEIPMYPYEGELKAFSNILTIYRDRFYRRFLKKYVDIIIVFTQFEEIFGIPTLQLINPIVVKDVPIPLRKVYRNDNVINIIAVASVEYYYGYDRLIRGLKNYYKTDHKYEVDFHLVGDGGALSGLKRLSYELEIADHMIFYGFKSGKELDDIYELADIGIDVLGGHRKNDFYFGTLKSREYMCKGLPFVTEYPLPEDINEIKEYILKVPADESDIDVDSIVSFFLEIKKEERNVTIKKMREFAYSYCDISVAMDPVINYLEG